MYPDPLVHKVSDSGWRSIVVVKAGPGAHHAGGTTTACGQEGRRSSNEWEVQLDVASTIKERECLLEEGDPNIALSQLDRPPKEIP